MSSIETIQKAGQDGNLMESTVENLEKWLSSGFLPAWATASIDELVEGENWEELNNRFFRTIAFGTGGMRDRTIGYTVTKAEQGEGGPKGAPQYAAVGSTMLNDFNIIRATIGLYTYAKRYLKEETGRDEEPRIVIACDVRHFSQHFTELAASTFARLGGTAMIFKGPRATPQLSYAVRYLKATCGVVITASHNPPEYNGFKAYFADGGQVVSPHAEGIIHEVHRVKSEQIAENLSKDLDRVIELTSTIDEAYQSALDDNVIDREAFQRGSPKVVFTAIHGTGGVATVPALKRFGADVETVAEQDEMDGRFPTVKSPNPEEAAALDMALAKAKEIEADVLMGTDPDADRMGAAVPDGEGGFRLLTGNQIGSLLAEYRTTVLKGRGVIPATGSPNAALIKTFVTTPLQEAIAEAHGLKVINTLTGFKWIGEKLAIYEQELKEKLLKKEGLALDYDATTSAKRAQLLLKYSTYYVFGGEESYGYLASDRVRDKDASAAVLMFAELVAALKSQNKSVLEYLDEIYLKYGYHQEGLLNIYYEGASGAAKIRNILESYRKDPPKKIGEFEVMSFKDFGKQDFHDADGKEIPKQDFYFLELDNGYRFAVRGSGTEPKIKFYVFAREDVAEPAVLDDVRERASKTIEAVKKAIDTDARKRAEA